MSDRLDEADSTFHLVDNDSDNRSSKKGQKDKQTDPSSKLGHVPCRFYKVGACTAGQSCPFSHAAVDRGGPKEPCQWFVKGNCKFGHKCALAHVLPGQPMSMDRKNKKAAQLSNQSTAAPQSATQAEGQRDNKNKRGGRVPAGVNGQKEKDRPLELKHERTPSKATSNLTATAPAPQTSSSQTQEHGQDTRSEDTTIDRSPLSDPIEAEKNMTPNDIDLAIPQSPVRPGLSKRFSSGRNGSSDLGYGPIGSPPNPTTLRPSFNNNTGINQFAPGTSPQATQILPSTSPFAQGEGKQHFFGGYSRAVTGERAAQSPIAIQKGPWRPQIPDRNENALESDDDMEELLPSSLNELLTPEERQRRLSRSGARGTGYIGEGSVGNIGLGGMGSMGNLGMGNHRYSRSVPAARLLEAAAAWKETDRDPANLSTASFSFRSANLGSEGFSPTQLQLGTSNASGAFLHGYARNAIPPRPTNTHLTRNTVSQSLEETDVLGAVPTAAAIAARGGNRYESPYSIQAATRTLQLGSDALSPSSRALQAHAPGQSLPQGLAAGLSRLHLTSSAAGGQHIGTKHASTMSMGMGMGYGGTGESGVRPNIRSPLRSQFLAPEAAADGEYTPYGVGLGGLSTLSSSPGGIGAVRSPWKLAQTTTMMTTTTAIEAPLVTRDGLGPTTSSHKHAHEEVELFGMDP